MISDFAIEFLTSLTNFVFDKAVLKRIAYRRKINDAESYEDLDDEIELLCTKDLLLTVIRGPWSTAAQTNKHGTFETIIGQQTITANALEEIKSQIRQINKELGLDDDDALPQAPTNIWINEWD